MTRPTFTRIDQDDIEISKVRHEFPPAQIGDEEAFEPHPPWWRRRFWRGLFRFVGFCALVFVIAYVATLLRDGAP
jgi:hypothetical protein